MYATIIAIFTMDRIMLTMTQIIDGFGSYVDDFMKCDVFRGIGGIAHKYYMLFQHHLPPPASTYTSDTMPKTEQEAGQGIDPNQMIAAYVHPAMTETNYIVGPSPGVGFFDFSGVNQENRIDY